MRRLVIVLVLTSACSGPSVAPASTYDWIWLDPDDVPTVTVLDPGAEPRAVPEYRWVVGQVNRATMVMDIDITVSNAGQTASVDSRIAIQMEAEVIEIIPEGYVTSMRLLSIDVDSSDEESQRILDDLYADLSGQFLLSVISPEGVTIAIDRESRDANELLSGLIGDSFGSFSLPWPNEPIGDGARWQTQSRIAASEAVLLQTSTHHLVEWEGDRLTVDVELAQGVDPDTTLSGNDMTLEGSGSGFQVIDLTRLFPDSVSSDAATSLSVSFVSEGVEQTMAQDMDMSMTIESSP